jgi:hypothetical protein
MSVAFHAEDSYIMFGGTASGSVVAWDMRQRASIGDVSEALKNAHNGPVLALTVGGSASRGFDLFSSGDDGVVRRTALRGNDQQGISLFTSSGVGGGVGSGGGGGGSASSSSVFADAGEDIIISDSAFTGCAWLTSAKQREYGRGDGVLIASGATGALEWASVLGR